MTVYADLIFFAEFFGDFLCLTLASRLCGRISVPRRAFAAALGGIYGVCATLPHMTYLRGGAAKAAFLLFMSAAALVPCSGGELLRGAVCFVLSSMLLSGGAQLLAASGGVRLYAALFGICCVMLCALSMLRGRIFARYMPCVFCLGKKRICACGFYDSGNKLYSGGDRRVIVADERLFGRIFGAEVTAANLCEFVDTEEIAYDGVCGGTLIGVRLDRVIVGGRRYDDVVLALSQKKIEDRIVLHSTMI